MVSVQWVEPVFTWDGGDLKNIARPAIMEFDSDNFLPDFLGAMAVTAAQSKTSGALMPEDYIAARAKNGSGTWKFYHPLHSRYYLVAGALVCRQLGLPDKEVALNAGESTTFVIRRIVPGQSGKEAEMAWVEGVGWQAVSDKLSLYPGEEQLPLHAVSACTGLSDVKAPLPARRQIRYGYIPVGYRKKYTSTGSTVAAFTDDPDPATAIQKFSAAVNSQATTHPEPDYRLLEFEQRVAGPWGDLIAADQANILTSEQRRTASLYVLLDMADFFQRALPDIWTAIRTNSASGLSGDPEYQSLFEELRRLRVRADGSLVSLATRLRLLEPYLPLVNGADISEPTSVYDLTDPHRLQADDVTELPVSSPEVYFAPGGNFARVLIEDALGIETRPMQYADAEETLRILNAQVPAPEADVTSGTGQEYRYRLRLVYEYDPECPPIVSAPSRVFTLAPLLDPDAPARMVKIELPSIRLQDMRKFSRGVGMQMTPELRKVISGLHKDVADDGLMATTTFELGMICTFSIQIIMLVAFIVMFIFLISLNFIFWWMAFLKICFPIPRTSSS